MQSNDEIPTLDEVIGRNLDRIRKAAGLSGDEVARRARLVGLDWSRSTVAAAERGTKTFDVAELVLLVQVPVPGMSRDELLSGTGRVRVGESHPKLDAVRSLLGGGDPEELMAGQLGQENALGFAIQQFEDQRKGDTRPVQRRWKRLAPNVAFSDLPVAVVSRVGQSARGEAERTTARRLGVVPLDLAIAAYGLWGKSLTEERDARFAERIAESPSPRSLQSEAGIRGRITRQLVSELAPILGKK